MPCDACAVRGGSPWILPASMPLSKTPSRRGALRPLLAGLVVGVVGVPKDETIAHDALAKCRKIRDKKKRKACVRKAREHNQNHAVSCAGEGDACRKKDGFEFCCRVDQPVCCNGGCWLLGSINCGPYCCPPKTTCCGPEQRCCAEGFECRTDCASGGYACNRVGGGAC